MSSHFRPPNLALTTVGLALATFMQVLDTTIANVSLPTIAGNMGVSVDQSTWVITSFAVSQAIGLPLTGYLGRRFGEVKVFVWCTMLFVLASFACGISQTMGMLIFFRVIQGAVCGPMYPVTQSLMISVYPAHKRGMALALISMVTVVAPIAGPILGGWITENYSWRWIFFINVPIGFFCSFAIRDQLKGMVEKIARPRMDYVGLITLIIGVGLLQVVLDKGNDADWFQSTFIVVASVVAVIALAVFVIWEFTDADPIVDLKLFRHRNFSAGTLALVLAYAAFFGVALLLPLWMQRNLGYTAIWAGLATAPIGVLPLLLTFFIGKYAARVDLRWMSSFAFVVISAVCFIYSGFNLEVSFKTVALVQLLLGLGTAFFFMPVLTILLSDLEPGEIASGSGVATFLRTLGGSFAASIITFLWTQRASVHHAQLTEFITPYSPLANHALTAFGTGGETRGLAMINGVITQQGFQMSFNEIFYALGWIFIALIGVTWFAKPPFISRRGGSAKPATDVAARQPVSAAAD
jgi:DHA2 family multidrug resistance protein